jgi:hypothetical protein
MPINWYTDDSVEKVDSKSRLLAVKPQLPGVTSDELQRVLEAWPKMSLAERHQAAAGQGLQTLMGIVTMPVTDDIRLLRLKADVSKFLIANQTKIEETLFKAAPRDRTEEILQLAQELGIGPFSEGALIDESEKPAESSPFPPARIDADTPRQAVESQDQEPATQDSPAEPPPVEPSESRPEPASAPPAIIHPSRLKPVEKGADIGREYERAAVEHIRNEPPPKEDRSYQTVRGGLLTSAPWLYRKNS